MIELQPEISALLEEVRLCLPSEEWECLSRDGVKAQMQLLRTKLAHYGEIQILRDANTAMTSAQEALQTDLDSHRKMHKEMTEDNSRTIMSLRAEVAEFKAASKKQNLHDKEAMLVARQAEHIHRWTKVSDDHSATLNAEIAELKNSLNSAAQLQTLNSALQDSIDKEKQAVESAHAMNQQVCKSFSAVR